MDSDSHSTRNDLNSFLVECESESTRNDLNSFQALRTSLPMGSFRHSFEKTSRWMQEATFVVIPLLYMVLNVVLACTLSLLTETEEGGLIDKAFRMTSLVSTAAITIVTLTFSLTVLSLQIASQMYSPRFQEFRVSGPHAA